MSFKTIFILCIVLTVVGFSKSVNSLSKYTYSKTTDFPHGIEANKFTDELQAIEFTNELETGTDLSKKPIGINIIGDEVSILFQTSLTAYEILVLNAIVTAHSIRTITERFCTILEDANTLLTPSMIQIGIFVAPVTSERNYTLPSALQMIEYGQGHESFYFVNNGSAPINLLINTGGSSVGLMKIQADVSAHLKYTVTNYDKGTEAYLIIRVT